MRGEAMGASVEYDDDVERRRTHPLLMSKIKCTWILQADGEILKKAAILALTRLPAKKHKKGILRGDRSKSILPRVLLTANPRSALEEDKYAPVSSSKWKHVSARFPDVYKALLEEPDAAALRAIWGRAVSPSG